MKVTKIIVFIPIILMTSILFTVSALNAQTRPVLFFSDLDWGPKTGWEQSSTNGAAITVWGKNFGSSGTVNIGGQSLSSSNSSQVAEWAVTSGNARGLERITFWLNSSMTTGATTISITTGGVTSNTIPFTIETTGKIYFISVTDGNNSYNGLYSTHTGGSNGPFRDIYMFDPNRNTTQTGGTGAQYIIYVRGGTYSTPDPERPGFTYMFGPWGTSTSKKALVGYPAETATLNTGAAGEIGLIADYSSGRVNYLTFAKLIASGGGTAFSLWGDYQRVIGCSFLDLSVDEWAGVIGTNNSQYVYIYGNYFSNTGASSYKHTVYLKSNAKSDPNDHVNKYNYVGWNEFANIMGTEGGIVFISTASNAIGPTDMIYIHDNYFHDSRDVWIYIGDNVPIYNVYIYNNIFGSNTVNTTNGVICVGPVGSTSLNAYIYNNTFYKTGAVTTPIVNTTNYGHAILVNNIFYAGSGQTFIYNDSGTTATSTNDLYYSEASYSIPSFATNYKSGEPGFVNKGGGNFHLSSSSIAIDAGSSAVNSLVTTDYDGISRPQGSGYDIGAFEYNTGTPPPPPDLTPPAAPTGLRIVS
jgi:hypothetical protein